MKNKTTTIILAVILAVLVCATVVVLIVRPFWFQLNEGEKRVTVEIISERDNLKFSKTYITTATTLGDLLVEKELVTVEESAYGRYITAAKGYSQDYTTGHYWMTKENGEYCAYGIDSTPLVNGHTYTLVLEVYTY